MKPLKKKIDSFAEKENWLEDFINNQEPLHHESIGAQVLEYHKEISDLIYKHCPFVFLNDLKAIITGNYIERLDIADKIQILHSELDADRIDYMLRDSNFLGTSYGNIDLGIVLRNLVFTEYKIPKDYRLNIETLKIMDVKAKGITSADQFMLNRFFANTQVIANRHVIAIEFMLKTVAGEFVKNGDYKFLKVGSFVETYIKKNHEIYNNFTDQAVWNAINRVLEDASERAKYSESTVVLMQFLQQHREIKGVRKKVAHVIKDRVNTVVDEVVIVSDNSTIICEELKKSEIYGRIDSCPNTIAFLHTVSITNHIPKDEFELLVSNEMERIKSLDDGDSGHNSLPDNFAGMCHGIRLLDGLTIVDDDGSVRLLIDHPASILRDISGRKFVVLREYDVTQAEQSVENDEIIGLHKVQVS